MSDAGGSARARYEGGRAKHRAGRLRRLTANFSLAIPLAIVALIWTTEVGYTFGPWLALTILFIAFAKAWLEPDHVRAWGIGARGEEVTEAELERLPDGYELLHDRKLPGSRANVDHIVIGPTGVSVVESKRMAGKLTVRDDEVYVRGRNTHMVDQVLHQVETLDSVLDRSAVRGVPVRPILFVQKADPSWFLGSPLGVPITTGGRGLRRQVTSGPTVLSPEQVEAVTDVLDRALRPMLRDAPPRLPVTPVADPVGFEPVLAACPQCGNEMVLRHNKQGQAFLGCSQFPNCRGTRPWRQAP